MSGDIAESEKAYTYGVTDVNQLYTAYNFLHQTSRYPLNNPFNVSSSRGFSVRRTLRQLGVQNEPRAILDAGCGSGIVSSMMAEEYPSVPIFGVDLVADHVATAKRRYGHYANAQFFQGNLMERATLDLPGAPADGYDVVTSLGVVHCLPDPAQGIRNIASLMAPQGIFLLYLYDAAGRYQAHLLREAVFLLGADATPETRVALGNGLLKGIAQEVRFQQLVAEEHVFRDDAVNADTFAHPIEYIYSISDTERLLADHGLEIIGFWEAAASGSDAFIYPASHLKRLFSGMSDAEQAAFLERYSALPWQGKARLLEILFDRHSFNGLMTIVAKRGAYPVHMEHLSVSRDDIADAIDVADLLTPEAWWPALAKAATRRKWQDIHIAGAGEIGAALYAACQSVGQSVTGFTDRNPAAKAPGGLPVTTIEKAVRNGARRFLIASDHFEDEIRKELISVAPDAAILGASDLRR